MIDLCARVYLCTSSRCRLGREYSDQRRDISVIKANEPLILQPKKQMTIIITVITVLCITIAHNVSSQSSHGPRFEGDGGYSVVTRAKIR